MEVEGEAAGGRGGAAAHVGVVCFVHCVVFASGLLATNNKYLLCRKSISD